MKQTGAELRIISQPKDFSLEAYDDAVNEYIHEILTDEHPELEAFRAVANNRLCLDGVDESNLDKARKAGGPFSFTDKRDFSLRVVKAAADEHSYNVRNRFDLEQEGEWTRDSIENYCDNRYEYTTTCIPVFRREGGEELIDLYFLKNGSGEIEKEGPMELIH